MESDRDPERSPTVDPVSSPDPDAATACTRRDVLRNATGLFGVAGVMTRDRPTTGTGVDPGREPSTNAITGGGPGPQRRKAVPGADTVDNVERAPSGFERLGSVAIEGLTEAVVGAESRYVFGAVGDGFVVVDVSSPTTPTVVAERTGLLADRDRGPLRGIQDLTIDGDRLVVAGPADPTRQALRAVAVFDVSSPTTPRRVAVRETDHFHHNVFARDGRVYLAANDGDGNPLVLLDADLAELGRWSLIDADRRWESVSPAVKPLHDLWVQDGMAALAYWDAGTWLVDVSDPTAPAAVARVRGRSIDALADLSETEAAGEALQLPGNDHYAATDDDGDVLAIGSEAWDAAGNDDRVGGPGGIELYDIAEPTAPTALTTITPPQTEDPTLAGTWTTAHNFELSNGRLYAAWYRGGVRVYDLSTPADPALIATWRAEDEASFWTARLGQAGEFFMGASRRDPGGGPARLYTFPDPAADAAPVTPPTPTTTTVDQRRSATTAATTTSATTATPTDDDTADSTTAGAETGSTTAETTTRTTGPGVGLLGSAVATTLAGLGLWWRRRQTRK